MPSTRLPVKVSEALQAALGSTMTRWKNLLLTTKLTLFKDCDMIRFLIGFLMVFGLAGGLDDMPPDPSFSYIGWMIVLAAAGFSLMLSGLSKINGR
jgi:hypothetical protein